MKYTWLTNNKNHKKRKRETWRGKCVGKEGGGGGIGRERNNVEVAEMQKTANVPPTGDALCWLLRFPRLQIGWFLGQV